MIDTLIVIAKQPLPGRVKTRLTPPLVPEHAARVAAGALTDTLRVVAAAPAERRLLAFDGCADDWRPRGWQLAAQPPGLLDRRLVAAFDSAGPGPALLVGMDTPQLHAHHLHFAADRFDACVGPASDGGYWAIGFREPARAADAIAGIAMSTPDTGADQLARLRELGLSVQLLDELRDVDTIDDARAVAGLAPSGAFARTLRAVDVGDDDSLELVS